jgi:ADP-heptose:LPS heptosyltransferase
VERILVIKLSALGDFIQAFGPFAAIRQAHPQAEITLLTTAPYAALGEQSPWFDRVWIDARPKAWNLPALLRLRKLLRSGDFTRVYDLQTSQRSSGYLRLLGGPKAVLWSGIAKGCSHPHANPQRDLMHTVARQAEQLRMAGISVDGWPSLDWLGDDAKVEALLQGLGPCVLLVPGGAPHRPEKRWPPERYGQLAQILAQQGLTPLVIGTDSEREAEQAILQACPKAQSLIGKTSFADIAALARRAALAVGNDTGPMHLVSVCGCPSLVLYSAASNPDLCGQAGPVVRHLRSASGSMDFTPPMVAQAALDLCRNAVKKSPEI